MLLLTTITKNDDDVGNVMTMMTTMMIISRRRSESLYPPQSLKKLLHSEKLSNVLVHKVRDQLNQINLLNKRTDRPLTLICMK